MTTWNAQTGRVAVVLLNYNGHDDTRHCLRSLAGATYHPLDVVVCDNASRSPGLDTLEVEFPAVRFVRNPVNLGFAAGCNVGIAAARENGPTHVVLLNNDTLVTPGFLEPLVQALDRDVRAGVAGGTILQWDGSATDRIWYAGGSLSRLKGEIVRPGFGERFVPDAHPDVVETGFVSGCLAMIPVRVLDRVGPLDEDFFFGVEDLEFAWRLEQHGLRSLYVPNSVIWHRSGRSRTLDAGEVHRSYTAKILLQRKRRRRLAYLAWLAAYTLYMRTTGMHSAAERLAGLGYSAGQTRDIRASIRRALDDAWRGELDTRSGLSA
jgi:hypothetical protein